MHEPSYQYTLQNRTMLIAVTCLTAHLLRFVSGGGWVFFQHVTPTTDTSKIVMQITMIVATTATVITVSVADVDGAMTNETWPNS